MSGRHICTKLPSRKVQDMKSAHVSKRKQNYTNRPQQQCDELWWADARDDRCRQKVQKPFAGSSLCLWNFFLKKWPLYGPQIIAVRWEMTNQQNRNFFFRSATVCARLFLNCRPRPAVLSLVEFLVRFRRIDANVDNWVIEFGILLFREKSNGFIFHTNEVGPLQTGTTRLSLTESNEFAYQSIALWMLNSTCFQ